MRRAVAANPDYVTSRPVANVPSAGSAKASLADQIDYRKVLQTPLDEWAVFGKVKSNAVPKFGTRTETIRSRIDDVFIIEGGLTQAIAEDIVARLRSGGSTR